MENPTVSMDYKTQHSVSILCKLIQFNAVPIKIPARIFCRYDRDYYSKMYVTKQKNWKSENNFEKED